MTDESKTEIVIATGLAAFLLFLWWMNHQQVAQGGGGSDPLPAFAVPGAPLFNIEPSPGDTVNLPGSPGFNVGGNTIGGSGVYMPGGSSCNCPAGSNNAVFGSASDLSAFLASNPSVVDTAENGLQYWY